MSYFNDPQERADSCGNEEDNVHGGDVIWRVNEERCKALSHNYTLRVAHSQHGGGNGSLTVWEPVLGYFGGDARNEGTGYTSRSLACTKYKLNRDVR